jgi:hypothetical protein
VNPDDHQFGNLQLKRLQEVFGNYDEKTQSLIDETESLTFISVNSDQFGGIDLECSGGYRLQVFPNGSRGENCRFFSPGSDEAHFVQ